MNKPFFITLDTEGDNLWEWKEGDEITTRNTQYLPRFQALCEEYGFRPVYLTNWEMAHDGEFVKWARAKQDAGLCEVGMHLHAWNTPPIAEIASGHVEGKEAAYLIEYSDDVMRQKFDAMYTLLCDAFGSKPATHRSGRWAMDARYYDLLCEYGIKADCSVTPGISWRGNKGRGAGSGGSDYSKAPHLPYAVRHSKKGELSVLELPVTIGVSHKFDTSRVHFPRGIRGEMRRAIKGRELWVRPNGKNTGEMIRLLHRVAKSDAPYCMFMIHTSELMPAGSPTFQTAESVEKLYDNLRTLFDAAARLFIGETIAKWTEKNASTEL